jgi:hypothetical protein
MNDKIKIEITAEEGERFARAWRRICVFIRFSNDSTQRHANLHARPPEFQRLIRMKKTIIILCILTGCDSNTRSSANYDLNQHLEKLTVMLDSAISRKDTFVMRLLSSQIAKVDSAITKISTAP